MEEEKKFKENLSELRKRDRTEEIQEKTRATGIFLNNFSNQLNNLQSDVDQEKNERLVNETAILANSLGVLSESMLKNKFLATFKSMRLALELRKEAQKNASAPWIIAISIAIACDCVDLIPLAGWIISWIFRPFLFVFLWGKGAWKVKLFRYILLFFEIIPFVNILPWTSFCVIYAYYQTKRDLKGANELVEVHEEIIKNMDRQIAYAN